MDVHRELERRRLGEEQATLDNWRQTFNEERPHESLGMRPPAEVYCSSSRKFEGTPEDLSYGAMASRKVQQHGGIRWQRQSVFISTALQGWSVGLEATEGEEKHKVWFGRLLLGQVERSTGSFEPISCARKDER